MAQRKKTMNDLQTADGKHVIISNRKKWKCFDYSSNEWMRYRTNEITVNPGSTPVSVISVKENGKFIREFKLSCVWNATRKRKPLPELEEESRIELEGEMDMIFDYESYTGYQSESCDVVTDFAISDETGVSCHTTSVLCRDKQKLVPENIIIECLDEIGSLTDVKKDYEIELKFGHSFMDRLYTESVMGN